MYVSEKDSCSVPLPVVSAMRMKDYIYSQFPKLARGLIKRFEEDLKSAKLNINSLVDKNILKLVHYPLTINTIFICMIEERVKLLEKNQFCFKEVKEEWNQLKERFSFFRTKSAFKDKIFTSDLEKFFENLKNLLAKAKIESEECNLSLKTLLLVSSYPQVSDVALAAIFEPSLKNLRSTEFGTVYLPASAPCQSLKLIIETLKVQLEWIEPKIHALNEYLRLIKDKEIPQGTIEGINFIIKEAATFNREGHMNIEDLQILYSHLTSSQPFSNEFLTALISRLEKGNMYWRDLNINEKSSSLLVKFTEEYNNLYDLVDFYIIEPYQKCIKILQSIDCIQSSLSLIEESERKSYLETFIPIKSEKKTGQFVVNTKKKKRKPRKKNKPKEPVPQAPSHHKPEVSPSLKIQLTIESQPCQLEKRRKLSQICLKLFHFSSRASLSSDQRKHLANAAWHIEKVSTIKEILSGPIDQEDYLNLLSGLSLHSAHALEQIMCFQIKKRTPAFTSRTHNLKILHSEYSNQAILKAVQRLYLATYWARYPIEEFNDWRHLITFHNAEAPELLESLANLAINTGKEITEKEFAEYCRFIIKEFTMALSHITSFAKEPLEINLHSPLEKDEKFSQMDFSSLIEPIKLMIDEQFTLEKYKLQECLITIIMLQRTLASLDKASNLNQFTFFATRTLFLLQESMDHILHALEVHHSVPLTRKHDVKHLAESLETTVPLTGEAMYRLSNKLKYPFNRFTEASASSLVDQITSFSLHPELDEGFERPTGQLHYFALPLKNISRKSISSNLLNLVEAWQSDMSNLINDFSRDFP